MATRPSRDVASNEVGNFRPSTGRLRDELARQGLPSSYIERLLAELDDHYNDLLEERSSSVGAARKLAYDSVSNDAQQRLGEPVQLAVFAAEQFHNRSYWGRHPLLTFIALPLPLLVTCWFACAVLLQATFFMIGFAAKHALGWSSDSINPADHLWLQATVAAIVSWYAIVVPPLTAAGLLCRVARRNALDWRWPAAACAVLAFVAGCLTVSYRLAVQPHEGQFMIGLSLSQSTEWLLLAFLPKFAVALGIGLLLVKRAQQPALLTT